MTPRVHTNLGRLTHMGGSDAQVRRTTRNNFTPGEPHVSNVLETSARHRRDVLHITRCLVAYL